MDIPNKYKCVPFWSWNDDLEPEELVKQIDWMHDNGVGGFFMHARCGLITPYLGEKWFECVEACQKRAKELNMEAYAYDENGWPSGFVGGKLLELEEDRDRFWTTKQGPYDPKARASFDVSGDKIVKVTSGDDVFNVYDNSSVSTADICNKSTVRKFLDLTHEEYKKHDTYGNLRGFFTDEPQYYRWGVPYTHALDAYFEEHYGEKVEDRIALLYLEKQGYRDFRYKYWKAMQSLMLENFAEQVYNWCDDNGYKLTGHYVEETSIGNQLMCCGGIMPFYEFEHIPGIDWLGRWIWADFSARQVASVASQLGKEQILVETFACVGWDCSPIEFNHIAESLYVGGINLMCQHLLPYSEWGQRKRDYPAHWSNANPWVNKSFKEFNDYYSELGMKLAQSREQINVGVFMPVRSCYFDYKRFYKTEEDRFCISKYDKPLDKLVYKLSDEQINFHFLDENIMQRHGSVEGASLKVGLCKYDFIIFPKFITMDKETEAMIHQYVLNGGKILLTDEAPTYLEGQPHEYDYMKSNTTFEEIKKAQPFTTNGVSNVRVSYRISNDGKPFFYVVNIGEATEMDLVYPGFKNFKSNDKVISNHLVFDKWQSYFLYPTNEDTDEVKELKKLVLEKKYQVTKPVTNFMPIDMIKYSTDGVNYSEKLYTFGIFFELLNKHYDGDLYLKYEFDVKDVPSVCAALVEDQHLIEVNINGNKVEDLGSILEKNLHKFDIAKYVKEGKNEIVTKLHFWESEDVYYCYFGENVQESIKNCLVYTTTIEAIYLMGNFGVYGVITEGNAKDIDIIDNMYLAAQKNEITSLTRDGYPFLRGDITLAQKVNVDDVNMKLFFEENFHVIDVKVNNNDAGRMIFTKYLDLSKYLKVGENDIEITLTLGNRNLLGPSHTLCQEDYGVGPYTWERPGQWKNGKCENFRYSYSLMKTII